MKQNLDVVTSWCSDHYWWRLARYSKLQSCKICTFCIITLLHQARGLCVVAISISVVVLQPPPHHPDCSPPPCLTLLLTHTCTRIPTLTLCVCVTFPHSPYSFFELCSFAIQTTNGSLHELRSLKEKYSLYGLALLECRTFLYGIFYMNTSYNEQFFLTVRNAHPLSHIHTFFFHFRYLFVLLFYL